MALYTCVDKGNKSLVKSELIFEISDPNYLPIHVHIAYMVLAFLAASEATFRHYSLQTALEVKSDLRFEISDPNYLLIDVHFVDTVWAFYGILSGHYSLQTALEVKTEDSGEIGDPNLLYDQVSR